MSSFYFIDLHGYEPYGRQLGIASNKVPDGIDMFTKVKVTIHEQYKVSLQSTK